MGHTRSLPCFSRLGDQFLPLIGLVIVIVIVTQMSWKVWILGLFWGQKSGLPDGRGSAMKLERRRRRKEQGKCAPHEEERDPPAATVTN
jgi:hypothetical protein